MWTFIDYEHVTYNDFQLETFLNGCRYDWFIDTNPLTSSWRLQHISYILQKVSVVFQVCSNFTTTYTVRYIMVRRAAHAKTAPGTFTWSEYQWQNSSILFCVCQASRTISNVLTWSSQKPLMMCTMERCRRRYSMKVSFTEPRTNINKERAAPFFTA